ncbi:hypothetical protein UT300003_32600 [Clostridium sardiniense]
MRSEEEIKKRINRYEELIKKANKESKEGILDYEEYSKKLEIYYHKLGLLEWVLK